jgi:sugar lactone lactonase YvrE
MFRIQKYIISSKEPARERRACGRWREAGELSRRGRSMRLRRAGHGPSHHPQAVCDLPVLSPLRVVNDLVFDRAGGLWFTDFGRDLGRSRDKSGIYHCARLAADRNLFVHGRTSAIDSADIY